jgi:hypothetical protein
LNRRQASALRRENALQRDWLIEVLSLAIDRSLLDEDCPLAYQLIEYLGERFATKRPAGATS